jgi:endo-1,4-beta-xylanase
MSKSISIELFFQQRLDFSPNHFFLCFIHTFMMVSFKSIFLAAATVATITASSDLFAFNNLQSKVLDKRQSVRPGTGTSNGFFYSFWTDGGGSVKYSNGPGGQYSVEWNKVSNFVAGKGWKTGSAK